MEDNKVYVVTSLGAILAIFGTREEAEGYLEALAETGEVAFIPSDYSIEEWEVL